MDFQITIIDRNIKKLAFQTENCADVNIKIMKPVKL